MVTLLVVLDDDVEKVVFALADAGSDVFFFFPLVLYHSGALPWAPPPSAQHLSLVCPLFPQFPYTGAAVVDEEADAARADNYSFSMFCLAVRAANSLRRFSASVQGTPVNVEIIVLYDGGSAMKKIARKSLSLMAAPAWFASIRRRHIVFRNIAKSSPSWYLSAQRLFLAVIFPTSVVELYSAIRAAQISAAESDSLIPQPMESQMFWTIRAAACRLRSCHSSDDRLGSFHCVDVPERKGADRPEGWMMDPSR